MSTSTDSIVREVTRKDGSTGKVRCILSGGCGGAALDFNRGAKICVTWRRADGTYMHDSEHTEAQWADIVRRCEGRDFEVDAEVEYGLADSVIGYHTGRVVEVDPRGLVVIQRIDGERVEFTKREMRTGTEFHLRGTALYHDVTRLRRVAS